MLFRPRYPGAGSRRLLQRVLVLALASAGGLLVAERPVPDQVIFNRDVRPILSNTCFKCHGPDATNNQSELRLDSFKAATRRHPTGNGGDWAAIVPGSPEESEMWARVLSPEPNQVMPPPDSLHQLSDRDRAVLKRWIEQGATYQPHWSYLRVDTTPLPEVALTERVRNPIDQFIQRSLADEGYRPSAEADRRTLARRAALDLTGLPPDPWELATHLADDAPDAYERWVELLLDSPHYGERMAVPWLDVVRFSDTVGFHGDQRQNIFPYRDYVIAAFNENKPYDEFVREQLAGDLMPDPTPEQLVATGFNRLNLMTREGGAQPKEYLAKYAADRVRAVSTAFLGSTVGCAECHDHKYDPFTTRDFYRLAAYFADVQQWGVYSDYEYTPNDDLKGFNNDFPFPPEIDVASAYRQQQLERLQARWEAAEAGVVAAILADPDAQATAATWAARNAAAWAAEGNGWRVLQTMAVQPSANADLQVLEDDSVRLCLTNPDKPSWRPRDENTFSLALPPGDVATVRLEALPDDHSAGGVSQRELGVFTLQLKLALKRAGEAEPVELETHGAYPDRDTWSYRNAYLMTSVEELWRSRPQDKDERQEAVWQLREPFVAQPGDELVATVLSSTVARVRFSVSPLGLRRGGEVLPESRRIVLMNTAREETIPAGQAEELATAFARSGRLGGGFYTDRLDDLEAQARQREGKAFTMITRSVEPLTTRVLARGDWQDESGEIVEPHPPQFLVGLGPDSSRRATRMDLANWIASAENPLTARTFVNRLWQQFFGRGLSAVVDDLGLQGEYPTHPELLDWLADEFVASGWDVRHMVRLIVGSHTYRQSSQRRLDLAELDPDNRLLAYFPPRRLEAEFVRDQALVAAGLLNRDVGGPSAHPYQPENYYESLNFPLRQYEADPGERQYRRGVYTHWQRTFLHPMLANFDAPSREECTAERTVSNTPQQALTLLNDPTFVEAARLLAQRALHHHAEPDFVARLDYAYHRVLSRPPLPVETASLQDLLAEQRKSYRERPDDAAALLQVGQLPADPDLDPVELAAWTQVTRVILNLNEVIVRY